MCPYDEDVLDAPLGISGDKKAAREEADFKVFHTLGTIHVPMAVSFVCRYRW